MYSASTGTDQTQLVEDIPYFGPIHVRLHIENSKPIGSSSTTNTRPMAPYRRSPHLPPGATLTATNVTLAWSEGTGVTEYRLLLGTQGPGSNDLFDENTGTERNRAVDVPNSGTIYARVYSRIDGQWYVDDAT